MLSPSLQSTLARVQACLEKTGNDQARIEAEYIVAESLSYSPVELLSNREIKLSTEQVKKIEEATSTRIKTKRPLQYIFHQAYFRNLVLEVNSSVLIPRPETELIIDILKPFLRAGAKVIDVGTGSGAIALALADECREISVTASDISIEALCSARRNRERLALKRVGLVRTYLLSCFPELLFDVIVANLPYVTEAEMAELPCEVRNFEPELALYGGRDGLDLIRELIDMAVTVLKEGGQIIMEIGIKQGKTVAAYLEQQRVFSDIIIKKDLSGRDRFVLATKVKR